jgi:hypothetical protein
MMDLKCTEFFSFNIALHTIYSMGYTLIGLHMDQMEIRCSRCSTQIRSHRKLFFVVILRMKVEGSE